jgi:hypothetical protein
MYISEYIKGNSWSSIRSLACTSGQRLKYGPEPGWAGQQSRRCAVIGLGATLILNADWAIEEC